MIEKRILVFARWRVKNGKTDTVIELLKKVAQKTWEEEGNLCYKINRCSTDHNRIIVFEGYRDEAAQLRHLCSQHVRDLVVRKIDPMLETREIIITNPV